jgi:hypothetical protein
MPSPRKPEAKAVGLKEQSTLPGAGIRGRFSALRPISRKLQLQAILPPFVLRFTPPARGRDPGASVWQGSGWDHGATIK